MTPSAQDSRNTSPASSIQLSPDADLNTIRAYFSQDLFATEAAGCHIEEAEPGRALCTLRLAARHRNAQGAPMGGAIFTLADFALAVASNVGEAPTVSVSNTIEFLTTARGEQLIARATADRSGRHAGYYTVDVSDELGTHVARMIATCLRKA